MCAPSRSIQRLPVEVVNRIAAGEVVQRPAAALKELLENALDAGSGSIAVTAADGGLDVLQVTDDGSGVRHADLPLLCERYATSKLRCFEDLQSVSSFGFRGEALASVSYVARVMVTTRRRPEAPGTAEDVDSQNGCVAWRARYRDGKLTDAPQPCAGNYGTVICAEKLFYNVQVRRAALKPSEEWRRLLDVVARYALAFPHVGFSCYREGAGGGGGGGAHDGLTFPKQSTTLDNIRLLLGSKLVSHLRFIYYYDAESVGTTTSLPSSPSSDLSGDGGGGYDGGEASGGARNTLRWRKEREQAAVLRRVRAAAQATQALSGPQGEGQYTIMGYTSDATLLYGKHFLTLFVNNRLVESNSVRRAIDAVYSSVLTGGNRPVTVLFLTVPADRLDVNVHPTKKEVCFLDEELVLGRLTELIRAALVEAAAERQVDVTSLSKATTLALQAAVRLQGSGSSGAGPFSLSSQLASQRSPPPGGGSEVAAMSNSAARGVLTFQQHQQQVLRQGAAAASSSSSSSSTSFAVGGARSVPGVNYIAPCTMVRVEPQKGALDAFLKPISQIAKTEPTSAEAKTNAKVTGAGAPPPAEVDWASVVASVRPVEATTAASQAERTQPTTAKQPELNPDNNNGINDADGGQADAPLSVKREADEIKWEGGTFAMAVNAGGGKLEPEPESEDDDDGDDVMREFKRFKQEGVPSPSEFPTPHVVFAVDENSNDDSNNCTAKPVPDGADGSAMLSVTQLEDHVLSSVVHMADAIARYSSSAAQSFAQSLSFVGVVDDAMFLAQSGTSLLAVDTLRLVREVVFQRVFLRWAQPSLPRPPSVLLSACDGGAVRVVDALLFALYHDAEGMVGSLQSSSPLVALLKEALIAVPEAKHLVKREDTAREKKEEDVRQERKKGRGEGANPTATHLSYHAKSESDSKDGNADLSMQATNSPLSPLEAKLILRIPALLFIKRADMTSTKNDYGSSSKSGDSLREQLQPTKACQRYVRGLARTLGRWREMLEDYFGVCISAEGELVGLPCGLNTSWPPCVRAVPLFLWLLAETVLFPDTHVRAAQRSTDSKTGTDEKGKEDAEEQKAAEVEAETRCFARVARLIAEVLYGTSTAHLTEAAAATATAKATEDHNDTVTVTVKKEGRASDNGDNGSHHERMKKQQLTAQARRSSLAKAIQFGLLPCLKNRLLFLPPASLLSDGTVQSVVTVESLYKVFERC